VISALSHLISRFTLSKHFFWLGTLLATALGALLRFGNLSNPKALVFDETYYVKDAWTLGQSGSEREWPEGFNPSFEAGQVEGYLGNGAYVVHPPIGKWIIYLGMHLFGGDSSFGWRFSVALLGTLAIPLLILVARLLLRSNRFAVLAGLFLAVEGQSVVMSRTSVLDGVLAFLVLLGFLFFVLDQQSWPKRLAAGVSLGFRPYLFLTAIALGLAAGTKWSGLYFLAAFGLFTVLSDSIARARNGSSPWLSIPQGFINAAIMLPSAIAVYVLGWLGWILGSDGWGRNAKSSWWESLWEYHQNAYRFHTGLSTDHPYASNALEWLLSLRPTAFYFDRPEDCGAIPDCTVAITAIPNPAIWVGGVLAMAWVVYRFVRKIDLTAGLIAIGFIAGWVPWLIYLSRTTFQFYSVVFTPFVILALVYALQRYLKRGFVLRRSAERERSIASLILLAMLLGLYFASIWMGLTVPNWVWQIQMWFPFWV
jgi:dolichyl-phosphate-mannose--protein O-mannosyl transferase